MSNGSIWVVYIIESQVSGKLYTGITNDVNKRLAAHNNGTGAKYTRAGRPWKVVYQETTDGKSSALKRELAIKKLSRSAKITLIQARRLG
jgi:predicted GIY-YIG superfamily endonuclease